MPDLKICRCGKIIKKSDKYCEKCRLEEMKKKSQRNFKYDKFKRDKESKAFYSSNAWQKLSNLIKSRQNGLCMLCYHNNVITKGTIVHHIVPIREAWAKRLDPKNCILLCAGCHYAKVHPVYDLGGADKKAMQELLFSLVVCG